MHKGYIKFTSRNDNVTTVVPEEKISAIKISSGVLSVKIHGSEGFVMKTVNASNWRNVIHPYMCDVFTIKLFEQLFSDENEQ